MTLCDLVPKEARRLAVKVPHFNLMEAEIQGYETFGAAELGKAERVEISVMLCLYGIKFHSPDPSFLEVITQPFAFLACLGVQNRCYVFFQHLYI